ncbi:hypothetical protein GGQ71_000150 [Rhizobium taibaishanense]|uniref:Uncharacterized protein n=1 Tax=Allorhizobium taibaishanense TaxID=887144 RepID=A0A7W6MSC9_9HYPH|nr:hypothetical protein [Allorhizobium taibaishanense]
MSGPFSIAGFGHAITMPHTQDSVNKWGKPVSV